MKVLVTGAAGFIGSHLVNWYAENGYDVAGMDNFENGRSFTIDPRVQMYEGDIRDEKKVTDIIDMVQPDLVNHHAARIDPRMSMADPIADTMTNYIGTINVVNCVAKLGCEKFIFASSCAVYGDIGAATTMLEGQFELPNCPYGISKLAAEKYIRLVRQLTDMSAVILRYPNVYGPDQSGTRSTGVIAIFAHAMARKQPLTIYGDGTAQYQYCFIDDIIAANVAAEQWLANSLNKFLVANIPGSAMSVAGLVNILSSHFKENPVITYAQPRHGEQYMITMDGSAAKSELRWKSKISLSEGIGHVVETAKRKAAEEVNRDDKLGS